MSGYNSRSAHPILRNITLNMGVTFHASVGSGDGVGSWFGCWFVMVCRLHEADRVQKLFLCNWKFLMVRKYQWLVLVLFLGGRVPIPSGLEAKTLGMSLWDEYCPSRLLRIHRSRLRMVSPGQYVDCATNASESPPKEYSPLPHFDSCHCYHDLGRLEMYPSGLATCRGCRGGYGTRTGQAVLTSALVLCLPWWVLVRKLLWLLFTL